MSDRQRVERARPHRRARTDQVARVVDPAEQIPEQQPSRLATIETWQEPNRKGTIAYVDDDGRPRGFLMWNVWDKVDAARELIRGVAFNRRRFTRHSSRLCPHTSLSSASKGGGIRA